MFQDVVENDAIVIVAGNGDSFVETACFYSMKLFRGNLSGRSIWFNAPNFSSLAVGKLVPKGTFTTTNFKNSGCVSGNKFKHLSAITLEILGFAHLFLVTLRRIKAIQVPNHVEGAFFHNSRQNVCGKCPESRAEYTLILRRSAKHHLPYFRPMRARATT